MDAMIMGWFAFALCLAVPGYAELATRTEGEAWVLENSALRVEITPGPGRFQVLDKRSGYLWRGPESPVAQPPELTIPKARATNVLDGDVAERATGGVRIEVTPDMVAHATRVDGPEDLSAVVHLLWYPSALYLRVAVRDEKLVFPEPDEREWWYRDSVEFWLNDRQYAVRFGPWGANLWAAGGQTGNARATFAETPHGYLVEVFLPAAVLGAGDRLQVGHRLRFAVGVNDCDDGDDRRQAQLYYPTTWVHSDPSTFALVTLGDEQGRVDAEAIAPEPAALTPASAELPPGAVAFDAQVGSGGERVPVRMTFALDGDRPDLLITVEPADESTPVGRFGMLHPLVLDRPNGRILGAQYCNGIGVPIDDLSWQGREWTTFSTLDMPWVGVTDGSIGYLLLFELPVTCDNGAVRFERVRVGDRNILAPGVYHYPIRGRFGAPRVVRYSFFDRGGHVAICKRYREYAREQGFLVTQREKMTRKPHVARLAGAPDVWGRSDLSFCREARAAGITRLLVNGGQPAAHMEEIKALGYLMSTYDNYEDAYEGDTGPYGDFRTETDAVVHADGTLMTAWLTHDVPPKQFMKRCTALFEQVARKWIPLDLQVYPYNARFLDVTTACPLIECYSDAHPLDRTQDREARRRLARYVGDELGLVLGGEHGRWWGADIYNYWEGMQSGGFYSWPAGYVGEALPQTREEIGADYLKWGLGEANRYPLWELVFHDCVVSTWYWGDSTGHLRQAAPELGYKQDAFNILYGTVPLYWVNQDYSYRWDNPETRARLLESYRNTCKLHEQIAFEEMVSHEFVTDDRAVQHTVFGDGTEVWVNFGPEPWTLQRHGHSYVLPQYGFYAKGPGIEQFRVVNEWSPDQYRGIDETVRSLGGIGGRPVVTCIRTNDYLYVEGDVPGLVEAFAGQGVTVLREGSARPRIIPTPGTRWVRINGRALCPDAGDGPWRLVLLDEAGNPARVETSVPTEDDMLLLRTENPLPTVLVIGPSEFAHTTELRLGGAVSGSSNELRQGETLTATVPVENVGGKDAPQITVAAYVSQVRPERRLGQHTVTVPGGQIVPVTFELPTDRLDGDVMLLFRVDDGDAIPEICEADNVGLLPIRVEPNWDLWDGHVDITVEMGDQSLEGPIVEMPFDPDAERAKLGLSGPADPDSIRVQRLDAENPRLGHAPCQLVKGLQGLRLVWQAPGRYGPGQVVPFRIYLDGLEAMRHEPQGCGFWDADSQSYAGNVYRVRFAEGYIRSVSLNGGPEVIGNLGVSSQDTGWVDERGTVDSFEVLTDGPLCTQIRVRKSLSGGHSYDKLYEFFPNHFTVTVLSPERFGTLSRAFYRAACEYLDDKGNRATIDGKGDAENIMGANPDPKWYITYTDRWAISCVAATPADNVCFWDASGGMAGLGFTHWQAPPVTMVYFVHWPLPPGHAPADLAARDHALVQRPPTVHR